MKPKPLQLKTSAYNFRKKFGEDNYLKTAKGFHAVIAPKGMSEANVPLYEVIFEHESGPIVDITRKSSLGALFPVLLDERNLASDPELLKELDAVIRTDLYKIVSLTE